MNTKEFKFSASSLKTFLQCGQKFKYEKVDRLKPEMEVGHARWLGKVVHASIYAGVGEFKPDEGFKSWELDTYKVTSDTIEERIHRTIATANALWDRDESTPYLKSLYENEVGSDQPTGRFMQKKKEPSLNVEDQGELEAAWKVQALKMAENGVRSLLRATELVKLEYDITFLFEDHKFSGFVDVLAKNKDGQYVYMDFKTVWDKPSEAKLRQDPQFILYSYALKEILGLDYYPKGYFVHLKSGKLVEFEMKPEVIPDFSKKFVRAVHMIERDLFYKQPSVLCGYCDFAKICLGN